jgi:hypothetical protein
MRIESELYTKVKRIESLLPELMKESVRSYLMGRLVPFINTAGIRFKKLAREEVVVQVRNRKHVQNHIHGVHACVTAAIAETASGFVTMMNCPKDKLILLKEMHIQYIKVANGDLTATATLSDVMANAIIQDTKGYFTVPVRVVDQKGIEPVQVEMIWAWIPRKKKS